MKVFERAAMLAFATVALGAMAFAAGQNLPAGDGKDLVEKQCTSCHDAGPITAKKATKEEWTDVMKSMQAYGASVTDKDFVTIVDYLTKSFGKGGATASDPVAKKAADDAGLPEGEGRELVATQCTTCHDLAGVKMQKLTAAEWKDIVNGMVSYGAKLTEAQVTQASDYLGKAYPK